jgi:hypothetical protein
MSNSFGGASRRQVNEFDDVPPLEQVYRTPNQPNKGASKMANNSNSGMNSSQYGTGFNTNSRRPPSGRSGMNTQIQNSSTLPRIYSRGGVRPPKSNTSNPMRNSQ